MTGSGPRERAEVLVIGSSVLLDGVATYLEKHCDLNVTRVDSPGGMVTNTLGLATVVIRSDQPAASDVPAAPDCRQLWIGLDSAGERMVLIGRWEIASPCMEDICRSVQWALVGEGEPQEDGQRIKEMNDSGFVA